MPTAGRTQTTIVPFHGLYKQKSTDTLDSGIDDEVEK